ncbi:MAG: glycogen debranching protein [Bacteroidota bacterium]
MAQNTKNTGASALIWQAKGYKILTDRVIQGGFTAKALSATEMVSDYVSPQTNLISPAISFKFSINGRDNEMKPFTDHHFNCLPLKGNAGLETPLITFGKQYTDTRTIPEGAGIKPGTRLTIKLDMRHVFSAFNADGYYTLYDGSKLLKDDFRGVFVAGGTAPLVWDFDNLASHKELELKDAAGDGIYSVTLNMNAVKNEKSTLPVWKPRHDISFYPAYKSDYLISDAIYNMSLDEMVQAIEPDSTFRTGKEWAGVWTRDISYSIILSMAALQPRVAIISLLKKVNKDGKIIQDTGTGGSYPVSSDRMIWAVAAWEVYKVTGDREWLAQAYKIIKASAEDDLHILPDPATGLFRGESSFLDWREQTYPLWMQSADIFESQCLGTNAAHFQTYIVLAEMAKLINEPEAIRKYSGIAEGIKKGINKYFWLPEKGYYGQFLYGRHTKITSPKSDALGEALCILFGIADADRAKEIVAKTPVNNFGIPCIYPQIPGIPPYHNSGVWPFVQSYWAMAAAQAGNETSLSESIAAIYRPAAMFLTNKENFVVGNGDYAGTQINSSNMLWSLSGNISLVYKCLFGMHFHEDRLSFSPFVPESLKGNRSLNNFKYRNAILDIALFGFGNKIGNVYLDNVKVSKAEIPAGLSGRHTLKIELGNISAGGSTNLVPDKFSPPTPKVKFDKGKLKWAKVPGAVKYRLINSGTVLSETTVNSADVKDSKYGEYQVIAIDKNGLESFASEPLVVYPKEHAIYIEAENFISKSALPYEGYSGKGFAELTKDKQSEVNIEIEAPEDGLYSIDFRYANGNGPVNTMNMCAIRTLYANDKPAGTIVFPQRGTGEWSNWGWSNSVLVKLNKGKQPLKLSFEPYNENMNGNVNQALIDLIRVIKIKQPF